MRWKILCILLLLIAAVFGVLLVQAGIRARQADAIIDKYAADELERQKFVPGKFEKPVIKDAPAGTTPILTASGRTHHPPVSGTPAATTEVRPLLPAGTAPPAAEVVRGSTPAPCSLDDLDVTLGCDLSVLGTPTRPWGRLLTSATISAWGQTREIPPTPASEVALSVTPSVVAPRWHADILGGVAAGERFGLEVGATWTGKSRFGPYIIVEYQPSVGGELVYNPSQEGYATIGGDPATWRVHAGLRVRIK